MADRMFALEFFDVFFVLKHLCEQAEPTMPGKMAVVVGHDAGALLPAVLQRMQTEIGESSRIRMTPDAKNTAFFVDLFEFS